MRILVVDSFGWSGEALARLLMLDGYEARWAATAADAIRLCETEHFDLLISELELSDSGGAQLMRELAGRGIVGISTTADPSDAATEESHAAGFAAHFLKPLSFDALCGAIRQLAPTATR